VALTLRPSGVVALLRTGWRARLVGGDSGRVPTDRVRGSCLTDLWRAVVSSRVAG